MRRMLCVLSLWVGLVATTSEASEPSPFVLHGIVGAEAQGYFDWASFGVHGAIEGERLGVSTRIYGMSLQMLEPSLDASAALLDLNLTYLLVSHPILRMRAEAGITAAALPKVWMMGPRAGLSAQLWMGIGLGLDGSLSAAVFPFRQWEMQGGAMLALGPFLLRGGWRALFVDDGGFFEGAPLAASAFGPYAGVALTF